MAKRKTGRPNKYETDIKPRFDEIREWVESGATDKEVAANLGIACSTLYDYKAKHREFSELYKNARKAPVRAIKAALFKRATGYTYPETRETTQYIEFEQDGVKTPAKIIRTETVTKYSHPDPASAMILLKHWARDEGWTNDPAQLEVRKQELELKKKQIEMGEW